MRAPRVLTLLLVSLSACGSSPPGAPEGVGELPAARIDGSLTKALALASNADRNVLVEYYSGSCKFCRRMETDVFASDAVKEALRDVVYVRMTKGEDDGVFEMRWRDSRTPSFVVLRPDGRQLGPLVAGALKESAFLKYVAWAREGKGAPPAMERGGT